MPASWRFARFGEAFFGQFAGLADVAEHVEAVARAGSDVQTGHVHRRGGAGFLAALEGRERVVHRLDAAVGRAADDDVARPERAVADQKLRAHAAVFVDFGFQAGAAGGAVRIRLVFVQFGHGQQRFDQFVHAHAGRGAAFDDFRLAAPFAGQ